MTEELKPCPFCHKMKVGDFVLMVDETIPDNEIHFRRNGKTITILRVPQSMEQEGKP